MRKNSQQNVAWIFLAPSRYDSHSSYKSDDNVIIPHNDGQKASQFQNTKPDLYNSISLSAHVLARFSSFRVADGGCTVLESTMLDLRSC